MTWYGDEMKAASRAALNNLKYARDRAEYEARRLAHEAQQAAARAAAAAAAVTTARSVLAAAQAALTALEAEAIAVGGGGTLGLPAGLGAAEAAVAAAEAALAAALATAAELAALASAAAAAAAEAAAAAATAAAAVAAFLAGCAIGQGIGIAGDWVVDKIWGLFSMAPGLMNDPVDSSGVNLGTRRAFALVANNLNMSDEETSLEDMRVLGFSSTLGRAGHEFVRANVQTFLHIAQLNACNKTDKLLAASIRELLPNDFRYLAGATVAFAKELKNENLLLDACLSIKDMQIWREQLHYGGKDALPEFEEPLLKELLACAGITPPEDYMDRIVEWAGEEPDKIMEISLRKAEGEGLSLPDFLESLVHVWESVGEEFWGDSVADKKIKIKQKKQRK